ncbi:MAG: PEGA domain-containing protein, partial [Myxococcota bacterium]|nr:PEGA domain-containing protein [Myxococcota bacterium]
KAREEERKKAREERKKAREEKARQDALAAREASESPAAATETESVDPESPWVVAQPPEDVTPAAKLEVAADDPWAAPPATPSPPPSSGVLTISSSPKGARVKVAGRARGTTPVKLELPVGTHEVRIEKADHATQTRYVKVIGTKPANLSVTLEELAAPTAKRQGKLFVSSTPLGAALYVDGVSRGRTPLTVTVEEGTHSVRLVYEGKEPYEKRIKVDFSNTSTVRRYFEIP